MSNWTTADVAAHLTRMGVDNPVAEACQDQPKRSKYNAQKTQVDGITFASKAEARNYQVLQIAAQYGQISDLKLQPRFLLLSAFTDALGKHQRASYYVADFEFIRDGQRVVVDVKGTKTPMYLFKRKLFKARYPEITFEEWT